MVRGAGAIAATLGTREPVRGQLRIALNNGVTKDEIVELFIHLEAYAGAARAFDSPVPGWPCDDVTRQGSWFKARPAIWRSNPREH
jgi:hypothetical protein